jgi:hypothetical protein
MNKLSNKSKWSVFVCPDGCFVFDELSAGQKEDFHKECEMADENDARPLTSVQTKLHSHARRRGRSHKRLNRALR